MEETQTVPTEVAGGKKRSGRGKGTSHFRSPRFRINNQIMWVVVAVNLLAPFFLGSNRPAFWLIWAAVLGASGAVWFFRMARANAGMRIPFRQLRTICISFGLLALYMIVQIVPFGSILPDVHSISDPAQNINVNTISLAPGDTLLALMRWLSYGLVFFFCLQAAANQSRALMMSRLLFWGIVLQAALSIILLYQLGDTIYGLKKWDYQGSATGGFVNRNSFATYLAFGSVLGVVHIMDMTLGRTDGGGGKRKPVFEIFFENNSILLFAMGWLVIMTALIASNSRMGVLAACCGMLTVLILTISKMPAGTRTRTIWAAVTIAPIAIATSIVLYGGTLIERVGQLDSSRDVSYRLDLYRQTLDMIKSRPLLGYGGNGFEQAFPLFHQPSVRIEYVWDKAHSTYLALWTEYGLFFGTLPIFLVGYIFYKLFASYRRSPAPDPIGLAAIGVIVAGAIHSLVDFSLEIQAVTFMFVSILAAGYARYCEASVSQKAANP